MKKPLLITIIIVPLLLLCCCCGSYFTLLAYNSPDYSDLPFEEFIDEYDDEFEDKFVDDTDTFENSESYIDPTDETNDLNDKVVEYGIIRGILTYPSSFLPPMEICAVNIDSNDKYCTTKLVDDSSSPSNYGYELELLEGDYNVYAVRLDENGDEVDGYRSYYSKFVTCGLDVSCPSHDPIIIVVVPGEQLNSIDPGDWYNQ